MYGFHFIIPKNNAGGQGLQPVGQLLYFSQLHYVVGEVDRFFRSCFAFEPSGPIFAGFYFPVGPASIIHFLINFQSILLIKPGVHLPKELQEEGYLIRQQQLLAVELPQPEPQVQLLILAELRPHQIEYPQSEPVAPH